MKKLAIALIVTALLVVLGANWFLAGLNETTEVITPERDNTTLRTTTSGDLVGFTGQHGARAWLGIPFAAAPTMDMRWRAPRPPTPWEGAKEALTAGPMCAQFSSQLSGADETETGMGVSGQEDCLYLNVWAPPNAQNLPVMLWIHGGGNTIGHGGTYDGSHLAVRERAVVISINYRLGLLGWFSHAALENGDLADSSGNYGTLDIVRALRWTKANVAAFGGNPNNVTIFGESAGGFDTLAMIASPLAEGLFHRAIVQSGGFGVTPLAQARSSVDSGGHTRSSTEVIAALMVADNTADSIESARARHDDMPTAALKDYLYNKTIDELFAVLDGGGFGMVSLPDNFADGHVLPQLSNQEIFGNPSNHNMVPTILGTNRDEPALFMVRDPRWVDNFLGVFPRLKDEAAYKRAVYYGAAAWKERGVDSIARLMRQAGNNNVYAYRFDWDELPSVMGYDLSVALGAAHGLEIAFAFGDFEGGMNLGYLYEDSPNKETLAHSMMGYWGEFARAGDPGKGNGSDPRWLSFGEGGKTALLLDTPPNGIRMTDEHVSLAGIKQQLASDEAVASQEERCRLYAENFRFDTFDADEYATLGAEGCGRFPVASMRSF